MFIGCSQKHIVGSVGSPTFSSLKERALRQKKGEVTLVDGQKYAAYFIRIGPDSTSWMNSDLQVLRVETAKISNVKFVDRGKGVLQGAGVGFLSLFMFAIFLGALEGDLSLGVKTGFIAGLRSGVVGLPIGAIAGSKDIYEMPAQTTTQAPGSVQQSPGSTIVPPRGPLAKYGHQIRLRAFAGVKYYKKSEDQVGVAGNEGIKGNGFVINKGGNWLEGTAAYISSGAIAIKMEGEGGIVRIPFRFIYELQVRKSNGEAWSPIWADDELALSRELGVEK